MRAKNLYNQLAKLKEVDNLKNNATIQDHFCKLLEEVGEFAQAGNKLTGRKKIKDGETPEMVKENLLEEGVDSIQCIFTILLDKGFSWPEIKSALHKKNKAYAKFLDTKL
jgi:NTP pyrophosphatase (non-canonical NTP hydrolase)